MPPYLDLQLDCRYKPLAPPVRLPRADLPSQSQSPSVSKNARQPSSILSMVYLFDGLVFSSRQNAVNDLTYTLKVRCLLTKKTAFIRAAPETLQVNSIGFI